jgi:predicted transposase/invertase (TIGR01784 family)
MMGRDLPMDAKPNREFKNSLFVAYLTDDTKRLIEVYNAVIGADFPPDSAVEVNTLDKVLYQGLKNDLSFTIDGNLVVLIEDQSTINMNMPLRLLMYVARIYETLLPSRAIYAEKTVKVPRPEFIVFYNGKDEMPDTVELKLSEAFKDAHTKETLELTVTVYNINPGHNEGIRRRSKALWEYSTLVSKVHEYNKSGMELADAIAAGVEYAIGNGVMPEFIRKHSSEVNGMLFAEYDPVEARKVAMEEGFEDGFEDGLEEGITRGIVKGRDEGYAEIVLHMKRNGRSATEIATDTGMSFEQIEGILRSAHS